uniref:Uncharacterized protein n=1 Tax=Tanacetum cinerariifolium TaxID=118510 RepID=A0A699GQ57_TANCI|nr:hypothetical protein [Tanacetum cinerariifolium]
MDQNVDFFGSDQIQTPQYPEIHPPSQKVSDEVFQAKGDLMKSIQTFLEEFNCIPFEEKPKILLQAWYKFFTIRHAQPEDSNELFQKLLEDLKELAEYVNSPSRDRSNFLNNNKDHSENSSKEIASSNSNQEKEGPPQDSDIRQLIREECCIDVCEEQKQNMEDTILELEVKNVVEQPAERRSRTKKSLQNFRVIHKSSTSLNNTSQISLVHVVAPILSTKEPEYSLSMGYEHPNTTPKMETDEIIKSGVEELVPILNECEVTSEDKRECDVPVFENSPICDDHSEILSDSNNDDDISSDDDDFEDIEYVEASLPDPEIDVVLSEKLLSINRLIANIESLNDNPTPDRVLNSSVSFPISEESDNSLSDNFSPEFETFCDHTKETRSGNTTTHADDSLPKYDSFCFEIEPDQERWINVVMNDISDNSTNDPLLEEADLFLASDNSIPPDDEIDLETDAGEEISVVINDYDELEGLDPRDEFDNDDYFSFMFLIYSKGRLYRHPFEDHNLLEPILYLVGLTDSWEHAPSIPFILIDEEELAFCNFMKKHRKSPTFSVRLVNFHVNVGSPFVGHLTIAVDDDQVESSSYSRDKGVMGHELVVAGEGCSQQDVMAIEGSKKRHSITEALKEEDTVVMSVSKKKNPKGSTRMSERGSVPPLFATSPKGVGKHPWVLARYIRNLANGVDSLARGPCSSQYDFLSLLSLTLDELGFMTFDELVDVYDIHVFQMAVVGNMITNESRILSQCHSTLKNDLVSLNSKKSLLEHEISENAKNFEELSMLQRVAACFEESKKKLVEEVDGLLSCLKETKHLGQRWHDLEHERDFMLEKSEEVSILTSQMDAAKLEKSKLVKYFLKLVVKKLLESEHFKQALGDLQQKAIMFYRSLALAEVHGLRDSKNLKDVQDYHPSAKKIFDETTEAFYKLDFPYISLMVENASLSFKELASLEAPSIQKAPLP